MRIDAPSHPPHLRNTGPRLASGPIDLDPPVISAVIPIYNEAENLTELHARVAAALEATGRGWEILFVDDGSTDDSPRLIRELHAQDARIKVIHLSRNFGHQPAITAGVHFAAGRCVVLLDGDLQDPPELIPQLVDRWAAGFQVVLAERASRADHGTRGLGYKLFYPLLRRLSNLPDGPKAGIFGLMDRAVVEQFNKLPERNRFIPGLRSWLGFRQTSVRYDRDKRRAGSSKQSLATLVKYAMDAMFGFSYKPLRWVTYTGFIISIVTFLLAIYFLIASLIHRGAGGGSAAIILCMLFLGGVQLIAIGILGEYVGRIHEEIKQRPLYVVQELIGFEGPDEIPENDKCKTCNVK
jgi:dolichol-phosphate mannosyltransferase